MANRFTRFGASGRVAESAAKCKLLETGTQVHDITSNPVTFSFILSFQLHSYD
jgi:hypothetical protein